MAELFIQEKNTSTPLEIAVTTRRLGVPTIIQPTYTFDVSDMYGLFVPCVSLGPDFVWSAGILDVSIISTDLSVNLLWNWNLNQDISIGILNIWNTHQDSSILTLNDWNISQDSSISVLDTRVDNHDTSILILNNWNVSQDASISWMKDNFLLESSVNIERDFIWNSSFNKLDVSTIDLDTYFYSKYYIDQWLIDVSSGMFLSYFATNASMYDYVDDQLSDYITEASLGALNYTTNASVNILLYPYATNASVGLALGAYATNASIGLAGFATNSSVNTALGAYATNASIGLAGFSKTEDVSLNYAKRYARFTDILSSYTINNLDNNNVIDASGTLTVYFPTNVSIGFQTTIINAGTGTITLSASTGATLLTSDSSVRLMRRYDGASAIHKGSGTWYAFGNLV